VGRNDYKGEIWLKNNKKNGVTLFESYQPGGAGIVHWWRSHQALKY